MSDPVYSCLPVKPCRRPGCTELVRGGGYCPKHQTSSNHIKRDLQGERKISAGYHHLYFTKRWKQLRAKQLIIEPFCRECAKRGIRTRATDVDHIKPHRGNKRIFFDDTNLQSLCHSCHSRKTIAERSEASPPAENV